MADKELKINIGCGIVYNPGFMNIDAHDDSVADQMANAMNLPYSPGTLSRLKANHLLEHFDHVHARYVLSHWFRLLKPGGTLVIETPDLEKSFTEFLKADNDRKKTLLQWIYGIQGKGMGHRTGFTLELLKETLRTSGFTDIRKGKQQTHRYESGLRVECNKPLENLGRFEFLAEFGSRTLKELEAANDSMELIPLESHCIDRVRKMILTETNPLEIVAKLAVCNPDLSRIFLETVNTEEFASEFQILMDENKHHEILSLITHLIEMKFHCRLLTLWEKSRKTPGNFPTDFKKFRKDKESLILRLSRGCGDEEAAPAKALEYINRQPPVAIYFFHAHTLQFQARIFLNKGIKEFHHGNVKQASDFLNRSVSLDPDNYLTHWNLARVGAAMEGGHHDVISRISTAIKLAELIGERNAIHFLRRELRNLSMNGLKVLPMQPVSEFTIFEKGNVKQGHQKS